jgi:DNA repair protein RadC
MGEFSPDNIANLSCRPTARLHDPSSGLCNHAGRKFIPVDDYISGWNLQPSAQASDEAHRSALARLIANVVPYNALDLANSLINEFRSLGRVLVESPEALQRVVGPCVEVIEILCSVRLAIEAGLQPETEKYLVQATNQKLIDYLVISMGSLTVEQLRVLFLDRSNRLIGDEIIASGSLTTLTAYPRNIFKRAFELSASAIVLVHNHPGGRIEPSDCDIHFTKKLASFGRQLEVEVKDHIIIAGASWFSFLRRGMIS